MTVGIQQLMWAIERLADAFHAAVYVDGDLDAAMATTRPDCELVNVPVGTGARGEDLRRHLGEDVMAHLPADLAFQRVSRTVDQRRVVQESRVAFTHDRTLPWLLPGTPPTHRRAEVLAISVSTFRHATRLGVVESRMASHRTLWDFTGLLAQLDLTAADVPAVQSIRV